MTSIKASGADGIYIGGISTNNGGQLIKDKVAIVGDNEAVKLLVSDGFVITSLFEEAGEANLEGAFGTAPTTPPENLTGEGAQFAADLASRLGVDNLNVYTIYAAAAAQVAVDAIGRSDGSRADVIAKLFETNVDTVVGPMSFNEEGDPENATESVYQATSGVWEYLESASLE
jgi:branched-chain amino acid transport system substrate-binding protein